MNMAIPLHNSTFVWNPIDYNAHMFNQFHVIDPLFSNL
jgi:hypothetical protein